MEIIIDTGELIAQPLGTFTDEKIVAPILEERQVYPIGDNKSYIFVPPQTMAVVTAYWEGEEALDEAVDIFKVLMSTGEPSRGNNGCCHDITEVQAEVLRRVKMCGWELKECRSVLVINTPGRYEVEPNVANSQVIVTVQTFPLQEFNHGLDYSA